MQGELDDLKMLSDLFAEGDVRVSHDDEGNTSQRTMTIGEGRACIGQLVTKWLDFLVQV